MGNSYLKVTISCQMHFRISPFNNDFNRSTAKRWIWFTFYCGIRLTHEGMWDGWCDGWEYTGNMRKIICQKICFQYFEIFLHVHLHRIRQWKFRFNFQILWHFLLISQKFSQKVWVFSLFSWHSLMALIQISSVTLLLSHFVFIVGWKRSNSVIMFELQIFNDRRSENEKRKERAFKEGIYLWRKYFIYEEAYFNHITVHFSADAKAAASPFSYFFFAPSTTDGPLQGC